MLTAMAPEIYHFDLLFAEWCVRIIAFYMYFLTFLTLHILFKVFRGEDTGGRLNNKDRLTGYGDPHVKDKTSYRPSYL